ncbi:MAG: UDP-2,3-diacylglucosamine diphosphatase LpxI [Nitrospinae bacterium]|nr:UDP-2,3-diacylglucosamine diphosphatase LpxI [Nitrospinota bacterium]
MEPVSPGEWIGLIAGKGRFPIIFAENAKKLGYTVSAVAHVGETDPALEQVVDRIHWIRIGQLNKLIRALKDDGVRQAVMVGGIKKTHLFSDVRPDLRAIALFSRLKVWKDDGILRAIAKEIESEGITIRESTFGLRDILVPVGELSKRRPTKKELEDIHFGWAIAKEICQIDIGQCVVVKDKVIVAVEAVEGTDEAIRRGGALARKGAVVVKCSKPQQDLRFDLPAVGPGTIEVMREVKASVLALEADKTIFLDREDMLEQANRAGIAIIGMAETLSVNRDA